LEIIHILTTLDPEKKMSSLKGLASNKDFKKVYSNGRSVVDRYMVIYYTPNGKKCSRIGFSVGKKLGNAVVRNRYKRILREITRINEKELSKGYDIVIIARPRIAGEQYRVIEKSFLKLVKRTEMFRNEMKALESPDNSCT
jgi:ribonuclease P protein component